MAKIQFISSKRVLIKVYSLVGLSVISDLFFFCNPSAAHYAPYTIARLSVFVVFFFFFCLIIFRVFVIYNSRHR